jgi:flagellin-like hook-associated protein FlgL
MNSVGKIFVVLIVILSLMFATMAVMIYATHKNYRMEIVREPKDVRGNEQVGWKYKLQEAYKTHEQLNQQIGQLDLQLQAEKTAKIQALAKAEAVIQKLQAEYAANLKELAERTTALKSATETLGVAQDNLNHATTEVGKLRTDIAAAHNETDKQIKRATELTDKLTRAEGQKVVLTERNQQLSTDVSRAKRLLAQYNRSISDPDDASTIRVDGKITEVSRDRVELSIGKHDGVRIDQNLDIYRGDKYVGRVRVVKVEPDSAVGAIQTEFLQFPILRGDNVSSRL